MSDGTAIMGRVGLENGGWRGERSGGWFLEGDRIDVEKERLEEEKKFGGRSISN